MDTDKGYGVKALWQLHKNTASCIEHVMEVVYHKAPISKTIQIRQPRHAGQGTIYGSNLNDLK